jgi:hypothetical protein
MKSSEHSKSHSRLKAKKLIDILLSLCYFLIGRNKGGIMEAQNYIAKEKGRWRKFPMFEKINPEKLPSSIKVIYNDIRKCSNHNDHNDHENFSNGEHVDLPGGSYRKHSNTTYDEHVNHKEHLDADYSGYYSE